MHEVIEEEWDRKEVDGFKWKHQWEAMMSSSFEGADNEVLTDAVTWLYFLFRSVSKPWKSFIDSSHFIKAYGACHTQLYSRILRYKVNYLSVELRYICLVEDDIETFKIQQQERNNKGMVVLWNPSIQKSVGISNLSLETFNYCFGVCPVTRDPTVVKFLCALNRPWHVEVFTLSSGVWRLNPSGNWPRESIQLAQPGCIDRFIYWGDWEMTPANDGEVTTIHMVVSFDLITKEFKVVDLPTSLSNEVIDYVSVCKLSESLVVFGYIMFEGALCCGVWMMENDSSFRKLFTIGAHASKILGFSKSGETIFVIQNMGLRPMPTTLNVYDPYSQQIKNLLGISGMEGSFFMGSYKESLLLLDHSDLHIYSDDS
ncbi:probable LRR receptor-like serine/threonine-protein kinase isoform X2 [Tanacetum coccineum]